ncbi:MAG: hypothetical protein AAF731_15990, partial [Bacteroidota bacterium]
MFLNIFPKFPQISVSQVVFVDINKKSFPSREGVTKKGRRKISSEMYLPSLRSVPIYDHNPFDLQNMTQR